MDAQDRIGREKQRFVLNHIRSVEGESRITSDLSPRYTGTERKSKTHLDCIYKGKGRFTDVTFQKTRIIDIYKNYEARV